MPVKKETQYHAWYWIAAMAVLLIIQAVFASYTQVRTIPYSEFQDDLKAGKIAEVRVSGNYIQGKFKEPDKQGYSDFITTRVDAATAEELSKYNVKFAGAIESTFLRDLLSWIIPVALFFGVWWFMYRRFANQQGFGGGLMSVGRSKAKVYVETDTKVTFADVAGVDEAKAELQEIVAFLKDPLRYGRLGGRVPKGVLLVGPPGTGKTLLARAVAGEANVPFFSINGSEFVEMFVGVGAARVRDLFEQAKQKAPCIIFIDELDALGKARGMGPVAHEEREQTLNQLLVELDGFDARVGVILLAATNRPEVLDPALLRAGRFDRQVLVDRPDKSGRIAILRVHIRKITVAKDVDLEKIASLTAGFTGADLANLINEAAIAATRRNGTEVSFDDFTLAIERIVAGAEKKSRVLSSAERRRVAYHEMGHALVAANLPGVDPVQKVSIIPRGIGALGYTMQRPTEDRFLLSASDLKNRIAVLMGGRAAERLIFDGDVSTGAADDLQRATEIAIEMVTKFGMDAKVGQRTYAPKPQAFMPAMQDQIVSAAEATGREIDVAVRDLIETADATARQTLEVHRADLEAGVELLIRNETLTAEQFAPLRSTAGGGAKQAAA